MTPQLIHAAVQLADALTAENAALDRLDLATAAHLLDAKTGAVGAFEAAREAVRSGGVLNNVVTPQMRDLGSRLAMLAAENRRLLERAIMVQSRVIGTIARAVPRAMAAQPTRYRRNGTPAQTRTLPAVALSACA